jgi:hypothetical protein
VHVPGIDGLLKGYFRRNVDGTLNHPGWLRFLDRLAMELPDERGDAEELARDAVAVRLLGSSGVGRLEMMAGVRCYLSSRIGASALVAEGVCLLDAMLSREEVRLDVGDLAEPAYQALAIVTLDAGLGGDADLYQH